MKLYDNLLGKKRTELTQKKDRLENGLQKLKNTASQVGKCAPYCKNTNTYCMRVVINTRVTFLQVEDLKAKLAVQEVELWQRNEDIEALLAKIGQQTDKVNQERAVADEEEQKVRVCDCKASAAEVKEGWDKNLIHCFFTFVL